MNSCFPPIAALNIGDSGSVEKPKKKSSIWGSNSNLKKLSLTKKDKMTAEANNNGAGKIEVLQDLDLYYIKQIAHNLKEYDLEQKIELEIKMREGATKLLTACKHQTQALEASKNLVMSNERMTAYLTELQKRKREIPKTNSAHRACSGRLSLSDLRIPLIWRDTDHFKNKGDYRRFAVFCLVKVGTEMYDTSLLCPVDRSSTDLTFPDSLIFNKISADFKVKLEVYSHMLQDDLSIASAPRRIKNTIHTSISRTVGKKLAASLRDELNAGKIGPNFELMASAYLTLDDTNDNVRTFDLKIENTENGRNQLPLFGHFCCRLAAQPSCMTQEVYSSFVHVPESCIKASASKDKRTWIKCWAQLLAFKLRLWTSYERYSEDKEPDASISVNKNTVVTVKKSSLDLEISSEYNANNSIIRFETADQRSKWYEHLAQHISDSQKWKQAADQLMEIQMNEPDRHSYVASRHGSLYDETPIIDLDVNRDYSKNCGVNQAYGFSSAASVNSSSSSSSSSVANSPPFRERSLSTSSFTKPRVSRLSAWPFSKNHR